MSLKAIFFDMDGVLVLSEEKHYEAWSILLESYRISVNSYPFESYIGISDHLMAEQMISENHLSIDPEDFCNQKREIFIDMLANEFAFPDGRNEFLESLHKKYTLAVVSSSSRVEVNAILQSQKIQHYFDFQVVNEDTKKHKPNPMPYQLALKKANVSNNEALVIEDSLSGIAAAVGAQISVVGIATAISTHSDHPHVPFYKDFYAMKELDILQYSVVQ